MLRACKRLALPRSWPCEGDPKSWAWRSSSTAFFRA